MRSIRTVLAVVLVLLALTRPAPGQAPIYPGDTWARIPSAEQAGWSEEKLAQARAYAGTIDTAAVMIVVGGRVLDAWGDVTTRINVHSIRKSFLSALYGIHVRDGHIQPTKTLAELGIDDRDPLTPGEKQATVGDLLKARSGVYHPALYETPAMARARPARGSYSPGAFWYYNNWDFNALGEIFQKLTGTNIFEDFYSRIAKPIGMNDFVALDGRFTTAAEGNTVAGDSKYPNYIFSMTARDMARFGYLYLRKGKWENVQVVPADWVTRSTTSYSHLDTSSQLGQQTGYGFLWWTTDWGYSALGASGHMIAVIPEKDLVIVHRVAFSPPREDVVPYNQIDALIRIYIAAAPSVR